MPLGDLTYQQWAVFLLILLRTSSMLLTLPFFGSPNIPAIVKAGLSLSLAIMLLPVVPVAAKGWPTNLWGFVPLVVCELMIGTLLGLIVRVILASVQVLGQLAGFMMGFSVANVLDPMSGGQISVLAQFCYLMALLVLFAVGGHLVFFQTLADSFRLVPPGHFTITRPLFDQVVKIGGDIFSLAVRLGAPVIGALLFTQVALGILAKAVPQMNILIVGFPLTITVGLIFMTVTLSMMLPVLGRIFAGLGPMLHNMLKAM